MTQPYRVHLRVLALILIACTWAQESSAQGEGVHVSYSMDPSVLTMHEPVIVHFDVSNESADPITVRLGRDRTENFSLVVQRPDGSRHKRPPLPPREGAFAVGTVKLLPKDHLRQQLLLNEWAELPDPGTYEIDVRLLTPIEMSSGVKVVPEPYHASFKVLPRDESRLKAACEKFAQRIESPNLNVRDMNDAALALAYVDDPVVVPYLERALRSGKYVEASVINGLARVGTEDAARVLITVVQESAAWPPNTDTSAGIRAVLAQQALHEIAATTSNESLKEEINRSVPE